MGVSNCEGLERCLVVRVVLGMPVVAMDVVGLVVEDENHQKTITDG